MTDQKGLEDSCRSKRLEERKIQSKKRVLTVYTRMFRTSDVFPSEIKFKFLDTVGILRRLDNCYS